MYRIVIAYRLFKMYRSVGQSCRVSLRRAWEFSA